MFYVTKKIDSHHFMVKDTWDGAEEMYSDEQLYEIVKDGEVRILGVHYKVSRDGIEAYVVVPKSSSGMLTIGCHFDGYAKFVLVERLSEAGILVYSHDVVCKDRILTVAISCIGGSWKWGYDKYGNVILEDKNLERKIMEVTKKCAKDEGIKIDIYLGEKGYTYFRFDV